MMTTIFGFVPPEGACVVAVCCACTTLVNALDPSAAVATIVVEPSRMLRRFGWDVAAWWISFLAFMTELPQSG
jgi:hypothetical protein